MSYSRREIIDNVTIMNKELYDNLQDGIEGNRYYVDEQVRLITEVGVPKLVVYTFVSFAETEGQTVFPINLESFDVNTDTVFVQSGRTMLSPNLDFTIVDNSIVLKEGVPQGRNVDVYVFKNIPVGEEGGVTGLVLMKNSVPLDRLTEMPTAEQIGALPTKVANNTDYNNLASTGYFEMQGNCPNNPHGGTDTHFHVLCFHHHVDGWNKQVAFDVRGDYMFVRTQQGGVWSEWYRPVYLDKNNKIHHDMIITTNEANGESMLIDGSYYGLIQKRQGNNIAQLIANAGDNTAWFNFSTDRGATFKEHQLFGQHNKPKKTYVGNGSATERVINTGGISDCFIINSQYGVVFVTPLGSFSGYQGTITHLMPNVVTSGSGYIWINSTLEVLNQNGVEYTYYSL